MLRDKHTICEARVLGPANMGHPALWDVLTGTVNSHSGSHHKTYHSGIKVNPFDSVLWFDDFEREPSFFFLFCWSSAGVEELIINILKSIIGS